MPACERTDWQDLRVVYGWEEDMTQEFAIVLPGPILEWMLQDDSVIPAVIVKGDRTYAYKSQGPCESNRDQAIEAFQAWCTENREDWKGLLNFLVDPEALEFGFSTTYGDDRFLRDVRHLAKLAGQITGQYVDVQRKLRGTYYCSC